MVTNSRPLEERFWEKVKVGSPEECWYWTAGKRGGYGAISRHGVGSSTSAHRISYELHYGHIPDGLCVLHKCDVRGCVNPQHLYLGNHKDNMRDAIERQGWKPHRGEQRRNSKLTDELVKTARQMAAKGTPIRQIGRELGIGYPTILYAITRKTWRHVP